MESSIDITTSLDYCLGFYREERGELPKYAILSDTAYITSNGERRLLPDSNGNGEKYLSHDLAEVGANERVRVLIAKDLSERDSEEFLRKCDETELLMILNEHPRLKRGVFCNLKDRLTKLERVLPFQF